MTEEIAKRIVNAIENNSEYNAVSIDDFAKHWGFTREEYEEFLDIVRERYLKKSKKMRSIIYGKHRTL